VIHHGDCMNGDMTGETENLPTAAMAPGGSFDSRMQRPLQYAASTVCSAVNVPSAYAQPNSPTEWPTMPSGWIPIAVNTSTRAT